MDITVPKPGSEISEKIQPWRDIPLSEFPQRYEVNKLPATAPLTAPRPDWICGPVSMTHDSKEFVIRNFYAMLDHMDLADDADWALIKFALWHVRGVYCIFVRPGSQAHIICSAIRRQLAVFPQLSKGQICQEVIDALAPSQVK